MLGLFVLFACSNDVQEKPAVHVERSIENTKKNKPRKLKEKKSRSKKSRSKKRFFTRKLY